MPDSPAHGKEMEEEEQDGSSQSVPAQQHSCFSSLHTAWDSKGMKFYPGNKKERWKKDVFPTTVKKGQVSDQEVKWKKTHDKQSAGCNRVCRIAHRCKQAGCKDPRIVLWAFNSRRRFCLFI